LTPIRKGTESHAHDAAGVEGVFPIIYASASDSYVFGYKLLLTSLFIVSGLH